MADDQRIDDLKGMIEQGFQGMNHRLDSMEDRLKSMVSQGEFNAQVQRLDGRVNSTDREVEGVMQKLDEHLQATLTSRRFQITTWIAVISAAIMAVGYTASILMH